MQRLLEPYKLHLKETVSTNDEVKRILEQTDVPFVVVSAEHQTAGRGQGVNRWESEGGKNLLFSIGVRPTFLPPRMQFKLLQIASLAIWESLTRWVSCVTIKWPNDIYYKEQKLSGTLIENTLMGSEIKYSVLGTGINVNQTVFSAYPPNPISLKQILGRDIDCDELLQNIVERFAEAYVALMNQSVTLDRCYHQHLFRKEGVHPFRDKDGLFDASIEGVESDGHLLLRDANGTLRRYAFKEVKHVLNHLECN